MALPRISDVERELAALRQKEGDIEISCDGFFGECAGIRFHVKNQTPDHRFWHATIHPESDRGDKVLQVTHL